MESHERDSRSYSTNNTPREHTQASTPTSSTIATCIDPDASSTSRWVHPFFVAFPSEPSMPPLGWDARLMSRRLHDDVTMRFIYRSIHSRPTRHAAACMHERHTCPHSPFSFTLFHPPVQPSCVRFTIRHPVGIAMVYTSGKYVCMGGRSTVDMVTIARKVARKIQKIGNHKGLEEYKVRSQKHDGHTHVHTHTHLEPLLHTYVYLTVPVAFSPSPSSIVIKQNKSVCRFSQLQFK